VQENDRQTPERLERIKASAKITPHDGLLSASAALTTSPTVPPREARGDLSGTLAAVPLGGVPALYPPCTRLVPTQPGTEKACVTWCFTGLYPVYPVFEKSYPLYINELKKTPHRPSRFPTRGYGFHFTGYTGYNCYIFIFILNKNII